MPLEIERRYLVDGMVPAGPTQEITQGYLCTDADRTIRVRLAGDQAWVTIKARGESFARHEFEYEIPVADAKELFEFTTGTDVSKIRTRVQVGAHVWEVDHFLGANEGLVIAEVELTNLEEDFEVPTWIGEEITLDPRYSNSMLSRKPYSTWESSC